nr:MAG TPA: hypothetical protein [Caudoviricetes sp.]
MAIRDWKIATGRIATVWQCLPDQLTLITG